MLNPRPVGAKRVLERLDEVYALGGGVGANRPAYSPAEDEAVELAAGWMVEAGLELERDPDGNLIGRLPGSRPDPAEVWTGSHLDSVPEGGRFDGALGVVAGIEAVERVGQCERTLGVVSFRGEEVGCLGSRAFCDSSATRPGAFVELHIEQGPRLAQADAPLGIVTSIAGQVRRTFVFDGVAGHAGTTPMDSRDDALVKAAEFILRVREAAVAVGDAVATVGQIDVEPGAVNVIPGRATVSVDARAPDADRLDRLGAALGIEVPARNYPISMSDEIRSVLHDEVASRGLPVVELTSWAGHDAGVLAAVGVASGMLFVRSLAGGVSHSPEEHSSPEDVELSIDVLAATLRRLGNS